MGLRKEAMGDAVLTCMFVFSMPFLGVCTSIIASYIGIDPNSVGSLFVAINVCTIFVLTFSMIGAALGGASFNPTSTLSFYAAGFRPDISLLSMAVRFPAQAAGAVGGAKAILKVMPTKYKHVLKGPSLKVDPHTGAIAEGVLSFVLCFALLVVMVKGPNNMLVKIWLLASCTVTLVIFGGNYTGPSMNPANAYGWAYVNNWHNTWDLFYVYWICPLVGAVFAAWLFRFLFKPKAPVVKEKKA